MPFRCATCAHTAQTLPLIAIDEWERFSLVGTGCFESHEMIKLSWVVKSSLRDEAWFPAQQPHKPTAVIWCHLIVQVRTTREDKHNPNETCRYDVVLQCTLLLPIISYLVSAFSGDAKNRPRIHKTRWFDSTCLPSPLIPPPCL